MLMTVRTSGIWYWAVAAGGSEWSQHRLQSLDGGLEGEGTQQTKGRSKSSLAHTANMAVNTWEGNEKGELQEVRNGGVAKEHLQFSNPSHNTQFLLLRGKQAKLKPNSGKPSTQSQHFWG